MWTIVKREPMFFVWFSCLLMASCSPDAGSSTYFFIFGETLFFATRSVHPETKELTILRKQIKAMDDELRMLRDFVRGEP